MSEEIADNKVAAEPDEAALNEEASRELEAMVAAESPADEMADSEEAGTYAVQNAAERIAIIEALIFVSEDPLTTKVIADLLREDRTVIEGALAELANEFNGRNGGLQLREVAGGWQFATRPEYHEHVRAYLKSTTERKVINRFSGNVGGDCLQTAGNRA